MYWNLLGSVLEFEGTVFWDLLGSVLEFVGAVYWDCWDSVLGFVGTVYRDLFVFYFDFNTQNFVKELFLSS